MNKIEQLLERYCPDGVEFKELWEVCDYIQPTKYIVKSNKYSNDFKIPVLTAGKTFILGYTDEIDWIYNASIENPVIIFDDFTTSFHWVDFNFKVKSSALKIIKLKESNENDVFRFIYFAMKCIWYKPQDHARHWISKYSKFKVPTPDEPIQQEIVKILDTFTQLEAELEAELEARKKQYEYYRDEMLSFGDDEVEWKELGEVWEVTKLAWYEFTKHVRYSDTGNIIALRALNVKKWTLDISQVKYVDGSEFEKLSRSKLYINDMLFTYVWTIWEVAWKFGSPLLSG